MMQFAAFGGLRLWIFKEKARLLSMNDFLKKCWAWMEVLL